MIKRVRLVRLGGGGGGGGVGGLDHIHSLKSTISGEKKLGPSKLDPVTQIYSVAINLQVNKLKCLITLP